MNDYSNRDYSQSSCLAFDLVNFDTFTESTVFSTSALTDDSLC
jgi:hypothetical protein